MQDARASRNSLPFPASNVAEPMAAFHLPSGEQKPLFFARNVTHVLNLEGFDGTAHVQFGQCLDRISHPHVSHFHFGLIPGRLGQWDQTNDVQLVGDNVVEHKRSILRVVEIKNKRVPFPDRFVQFKTEKSGGVRGCFSCCEISGRNGNSRDRQLFTRVRILHQNRSPKRNRLLPLPANQPEDAGPENTAAGYATIQTSIFWACVT